MTNREGRDVNELRCEEERQPEAGEGPVSARRRQGQTAHLAPYNHRNPYARFQATHPRSRSTASTAPMAEFVDPATTPTPGFRLLDLPDELIHTVFSWVALDFEYDERDCASDSPLFTLSHSHSRLRQPASALLHRFKHWDGELRRTSRST